MCDKSYFSVAYGWNEKVPSIIVIGGDKAQWRIQVDQKFNWFQKRMLKWCFGFDVKENK